MIELIPSILKKVLDLETYQRGFRHPGTVLEQPFRWRSALKTADGVYEPSFFMPANAAFDLLPWNETAFVSFLGPAASSTNWQTIYSLTGPALVNHLTLGIYANDKSTSPQESINITWELVIDGVNQFAADPVVAATTSSSAEKYIWGTVVGSDTGHMAPQPLKVETSLTVRAKPNATSPYFKLGVCAHITPL